MKTKMMDQSALNAWVAVLIKEQTVYGVQAKGDRFAFDELDVPEDLRLDYDVTILPPRKYFQPQKEALLSFNRKTVQFESIIHEEPFVVFGVHPYDMAAISQMDKVFSMNNYDNHYMARRNAATIVVVDVQKPSSSVFAGSMGHATAENNKDYDVLLTRVEDGTYVVESKSEKGDALCEAIADAADAGEDALQARTEVWEHNKNALKKFELKMDPSELPALLDKTYDHPVWEEKSVDCYSCGSCNLVCPTCYCFTVEDEMNWDMETGVRYRSWHGCMLERFATVAGNHNFRGNQAHRYRHRYLRKGKYTFEQYGEIGCIGCGRCITACTVNIANPVEVFNRLMEDE